MSKQGIFKCECGNERILPLYRVLKLKSCGRCSEQYVGKKFGKLTILKFIKSNPGYGGRFDVICECGKKRTCVTSVVLSGKLVSCGCYRPSFKHGQATGNKKTDEYKAWQHMISRCYGKSEWNKHYYQKRGITVYDEWRGSFLAFLRDVGRKPSKDMSLERIDNDLGYYPGNVMWATRLEQSLNTRPHGGRYPNTSGVTGVSWRGNRKKWRAYIVINGKQKMLGYFDTKEEAVAARKKGEEMYHAPIILEKYKRLNAKYVG